ncbi:MAG: DNA-binding transcriptional activator of the SARP family protein [Candidatus Accumulibacter sp. SK-11]|nr:MAG: DNA-binding transcriptional activator of the SARP family protein [Candidatus Accumulibacter sp. SK-11]
MVRALADLAGALCRGSPHDEAAKLCERATAIDPGRERLYRDWMICLQQQGEVAEGLRAYQRCRQVLADRLDSRPSAATEALRRALRWTSSRNPEHDCDALRSIARRSQPTAETFRPRLLAGRLRARGSSPPTRSSRVRSARRGPPEAVPMAAMYAARKIKIVS